MTQAGVGDCLSLDLTSCFPFLCSSLSSLARLLCHTTPRGHHLYPKSINVLPSGQCPDEVTIYNDLFLQWEHKWFWTMVRLVAKSIWLDICPGPTLKHLTVSPSSDTYSTSCFYHLPLTVWQHTGPTVWRAGMSVTERQGFLFCMGSSGPQCIRENLRDCRTWAYMSDFWLVNCHHNCCLV